MRLVLLNLANDSYFFSFPFISNAEAFELDPVLRRLWHLWNNYVLFNCISWEQKRRNTILQRQRSYIFCIIKCTSLAAL